MAEEGRSDPDPDEEIENDRRAPTPLDATQALRERRFLVTALIILGVLTLYISWPFLPWVLLGLVFAYVLYPVFRRLASWTGKPGLSASTIVALVALVVGTAVFLFAMALAEDVRGIIEQVQDDGAGSLIEGALAEVLPKETAQQVSNWLSSRAQTFVVDAIPTIIDMTIHVTIGIFVFGAMLYGGLALGKETIQWFWHLLPMRGDREGRVLDEVRRAVDSVLYGLVVVGFVQGAAGAILWWVTGLPNVFFWGVAMFVLGMIPNLGPILILGPGAVWLYLQGDTVMAIVLIVGAVALVGPIDNFLRPYLMGKKGGLAGPLVLLSVVGGLTVLGPMGLFLGPLVFALTIKVAELAWETRNAEAHPSKGNGA
ncbi:MAG: AI-2E family transporter [Euryarchaeota archaeon]|nr:AI-2E family transporter [Euryarchaeota archaeon]